MPAINTTTIAMKKNFTSFLLFLFLLFSCNNNNTGTTTQAESQTVPEVKSVFINGDSLHYIEIGKGEPIVFVHGTLGDYRVWRTIMDTFAKSHRVIAYSRRFAYPNTQIINDSTDYSLTIYSKDLAEFLKALKLGPVHIVGHSFGAFVSLLTTMDHPELVRSLTVGEPPVMSLLKYVPGGDTVSNNFVSKALMPAAEAFRNNEQEKAVRVFAAGVMNDSAFFSKLPPQVRDGMMTNTLELRGIVFSKNIFLPLTCEDLQKIKTPVLVLNGDKSPLYHILINKELDRCINNNEEATFLNTSHGLHNENPSEFINVVLAFIDKH
jgi:pimeloyl-ACP methyl ester carboxylesterase